MLDGVRDLFVGDDAVDHTLALHPIEEASVAVDVVILQVDERDPSIAEGEVVTFPVRLDQLVLDDPVEFSVEFERIVLEVAEGVFPHVEGELFFIGEVVVLGEPNRPAEILALDVEGGDLASVGEPDPLGAGHIVADLANRTDRILEGHVSEHDLGLFEHAQHERARADLQEVGVLAHIRVAHDHMEPAVALGVGVGFVAGVDDRAASRGSRADALPDVLGSLTDAISGAPRRLQDLAGTGIDLPADEERNEHLGVRRKIIAAACAVVLVAAVAVAGGVGVVLEQVDVAVHAFVTEALLGADEELFEDPLPCLVVHNELTHAVAFGRGVLGVAADVEVEPSAVGEEDVAAATPRHHPSEEVSGDFVRTQSPLAAQGARDAVFVLDAEDPSLHVANLTSSSTMGAVGAGGWSMPSAGGEAAPTGSRVRRAVR